MQETQRDKESRLLTNSLERLDLIKLEPPYCYSWTLRELN